MWARTLFISFLLAIHSYATDRFPAKITIKTGRQIETNVLKVYEWGLKLENNLAVIYKVIREIETVDDSLANLITAVVPGIQISKSSENRTILDFQNAQPLPLKPVQVVSSGRIFAFAASSNELERFEVQFYIRSFIFNSSLLYFGLSAGAWEHERDISRFGAIFHEKARYSSKGLVVGIGAFHRINERNELVAMFSYAVRSVAKSADVASSISSSRQSAHRLLMKR